MRALMEIAERDPAASLVVNLETMRVTAGEASFEIALPASAREAFLDGSWDATGLLVDDFDAVRRVAARLPYVSW
jgi:3-isopropylmalate/(R)-2-methylmalate dehydratase small subunit